MTPVLHDRHQTARGGAATHRASPDGATSDRLAHGGAAHEGVLCERRDGAGCRQQTSLPFTVSVTRDLTLLQAAAQVRQEAFARHLPDGGLQLSQPERDDLAEDCVVWVARDKRDGAVLGSMRVQSNRQRLLDLERWVQLPQPLPTQRLSDARRLAVLAGPRAQGVRQALFKANLMHLLACGVAWCVVGARPSLARIYQGLLFTNLLPGVQFVPEPVAQMPVHVVLGFALAGAEQRFAQAHHPWHHYLFATDHPDIHLPDPAGSALGFAPGASAPRARPALPHTSQAST